MKKQVSPLTFDRISILSLLTLFTIILVSFVSLSSKDYKDTVAMANINGEQRNITSYLREKVHQHTFENGIRVTKIENTDVLLLSSIINEQTYETLIYYHNGYLREMFLQKGSSYTLSSGQPLMELKHFSISHYQKECLSLSFETKEGKQETIYLYVPENCMEENF